MNSLSKFNRNGESGHEDEFHFARKMATHLLAQLAPVSPLVYSQTKNESDAEAWIDSWARHIIENRIQPVEIQRGLSNIGETLRSRNAPFSLALFLDAARPERHLRGDEYEMRKKHHSLLMIKEDLLQNQGWVTARNRAFNKIKKIGYQVMTHEPKEDQNEESK